ncbi:MAG: hypothetical protein ACRDD8_05345 [Bacteroidales bacterium]
MDYSSLNLKIRARTTLCKLPLPLLIDVANITNNRETVIDCTITLSNDKIIYDRTKSPFAKTVDYNLLVNRLKDVWNSIDMDLAYENDTIISLLNVTTFEEFEELCLHTDLCTMEEILNILNEISFYNEKLKKNFIEECISIFDLRREFPKIMLKDDNMSAYIGKYNEYFSYPESMYALQLVSEYPMSIWFPENIGKSFMEWSWREIECKKMYMAMKNITENFRELVKAKALEVSRESK